MGRLLEGLKHYATPVLLLYCLFVVLHAYVEGGDGFRLEDFTWGAVDVTVLMLVFFVVTRGWGKLGTERQKNVRSVTWFLIKVAITVVMVGAIWWVWDVPDIWDRSLGTLSLGDIAWNVIKYVVLWVVGISLLKWTFKWRRAIP